MRTAFPKPANAAQRALNKYKAVLESLLNQCGYLGADPWNQKFKTYTISLHELANRGGQIGPQRVRVHSWLQSTGHALVQTVVLGTNISGMKSRVKLTKLTSIQDHYNVNQALAQIPATIASLDSLPNHQECIWIQGLYPGLTELDRDEIISQYELVTVNQNSLKVFLQWIIQGKIVLDSQRKQLIYRQALLIYRMSQLTSGVFLQKPKHSHFGRTYYHGVSVQNVPKILRAAMLGDAWEYDITSSVIAWKLGYGDILAQACGETVQDLFPYTTLYLEDKQDLIKTIRAYVFSGSTKDTDQQTKMIKTALTALGFGAHVRTNGWKDSQGQWQYPAMAKVFTNQIELAKFVGMDVVVNFVAEQRMLDKFIYSEAVRTNHQLRGNSLLTTPSGRLSKSRVLAYMYQHAETLVMNACRAGLAQFDRTVLASIHDAIVIRERLSQYELEVIVDHMRSITQNRYWSLTGRVLMLRDLNLHRYLSQANVN
jgi:hypothetical protein